MKTAIAILAAGVLSASAAAYAQNIQSNSQVGAGQPSPMALPQMPANPMSPVAANAALTDIYSFMALFQKLAQEQRNVAREQRSAAMEAQIQALQAAAGKMQQAAAAAMQQAMLNGQMQAATGALSIAQSTRPGLTQPAPTVATKNPAGQMSAGQGAVAGQIAGPNPLTPQQKQQAMTMSMGAQQAFAANMAGAAADKKKAEEAAAAAQGQGAQQTQQQAQQQMQQMQDMIRDIQQKLQAIMQAQNATTQQLIRN